MTDEPQDGPVDEPDDRGRLVRVTVDLQEDFALHQPLAPFALAAFDLLDPAAPTYALDVVSVLEAVLEDPGPVAATPTPGPADADGDIANQPVS